MECWEGSLPECGWPVHSFVRATNTMSQELNLNELFDFLIGRGLSSSTYLISVEASADQLDTTAYAVEIGEASSIR